MRVGRSASKDARLAAEEAASQAVGSDTASLIVVFCSDAYNLDLLIRTISERTGGVSLIGCTTAGEIAASGPGDASVVVTAFGGEGFSVATALATNVSGRLRQASAEVASSVARVAERPHKVLMLLSDGLSGDQQEVVRGAYSVVGAAVPLVGGCAGDDLKMKRTFVFYGTQVVSNAVVGAAIASDSPMGIGVRHGWRRVGEPMLVTGSSDNHVYTLDDKPALDIYLERLNVPAAARTDAAAFTRFAITHPLGLSRRSGEEVRFVGEANFEDRSLVCIAGVPQGGLAWFMEGDDESVLAATDAACGDALASLEGHPAVGFLAFDCIARRGVLGDEGIRREVARIGLHAGGAPIAGFYTYGEIARTNGVSGFHNQTLVILALS
jgi:hypothetical protein